ncbi:MAG: retropepsin-like aspartic protease [Terracidiphilus sp.]
MKAANAFAILLSAVLVPAACQTPTHSVHMDLEHDKPYVMVMVNGQGPFRFIVDTGTGGQAIITPELADKLQLPVIGQARLGDPSGQGRQDAKILSIQSLNLAGVEFTNVRALRHSLAGEDDVCMGLLGFTLFREYLLTLDYPNHNLSLSQGSLAKDGEKSVLPFRMPYGVPIAPLSIGDERIEAQIDSGGIGLTLPEKLAVRLKFASTPVVYANGESLSTRFQLKAARLGTDVHLGRYTFAQPVVEIHPAFPLVNLGACPMQNFTVTFDQRNLLVRFASDRTALRLDSMPTTIRMQSVPSLPVPNVALVPVG